MFVDSCNNSQVVIMIKMVTLGLLASALLVATISAHYNNTISSISTISQTVINMSCPCDVKYDQFKTKVDCFNKSITDIESLYNCIPVNTTWLDLSNNSITAVYNGTFERFPDLQCLNLSYNKGFHFLDREAFRGLKNLTTLNITALRNSSILGRLETPVYIQNGTFSFMTQLTTLIINYWTGKTLQHIKNFQEAICDLKNTKIEAIHADGINTIDVVWVMQDPLFACLENTTLKMLVMRKNFIVSIMPPVLDYLKNLIYLDFSYNVIVGGDNRLLTFNLYMMPKLEKFIMSYQSYIEFDTKLYPDLADHTKPHSSNRNLQNGLQQHHVHNCTQKIVLPQTLTHMDISHRNSILHGFILDGICVDGNNSLTHLNFANNWLEAYIFGPVLQFPQLLYLNLHGSRMVFSSKRMFEKLGNLQTLNLSQCALQMVIHFEGKNYYKTWQEIRTKSNLTSLKHLDMNRNGLSYLPDNLFHDMHKLTHITLAHNVLSNISFNMSHLNYLSLFDLSFNRISFLPSSLMQLWPNVSFMVNLANNSILTNSCSDIVPLKKLSEVEFWKRINVTGLLIDKKYVFNQDTPITDYYHHMLGECYNTWTLIVSFTLYGISIVLITVLTSVRRLRWRFIYMWKYAKLLLHNHQRDSCDLTGKEYDAFVCYSRQDYNWVIKKLLPMLENQHGYQLCIHERDFEPGAPIDVNIVQSFCLSRSVIFVITRQALRSSFLNFELHIAREHKGTIICVLLEDPNILAVEVIPPTLQFFMDTVTYVRWPSDKMEQKTFWARLVKSLGRPMSVLLERNNTSTSCNA